MKFDDLTCEQRRVVESGERCVLVLGGAGSGKTTVALWSARHELERADTSSWHRALFLTFSRTAVREIIRRSRGAVAPIRERLEIQTFHSFAHRLVQSFGRFVGLGREQPQLQSPPQIKLFGRNRQSITYDDLLPRALAVLRDERVKRLLAERWPLVICDEFQDTSNEQWQLLCELAQNSRLVLLADPNQLIYGFLSDQGVGPQRVEEARKRAELVVDLGSPSHRDPSGVIPAMATAGRQRRFDDPAIAAAIKQDRLRVYGPIVEVDLINAIRVQVVEARRAGANSVGIFAHTNQAVADLSAGLIEAGLDHVLVGLPEAHGEALAVMEALCRHALGAADITEVKHHLAVFLTSAVRGSTPDLAHMLIGRAPLPKGLEQRIIAASESLQAAASEGLEQVVAIAMDVWIKLGINPGRRPWQQASRTFGATAQQILSGVRGSEELFAARLGSRVAQLRSESLLDAGLGSPHPIQLMNFHQTKGREADVVILVYRDDDWFGREREPFPENSKLLYVSLTRARQRDVVLMPASPHPLVAPLATFTMGLV